MSARIAAAAALAAGLLLLGRHGVAAAHVLMFPSRVAPGSFTLFTVVSPDEKTSPLTGLTLDIPPNLVVDSVQPAAGFRTQIVRDQTLRVIGLRWSGGRIPPGQMAVFRFTALAPAHATTIPIPAVQTFADGSTQIWHTASLEIARPSSGGTGASTLSIAALVVAVVAAVVAIAAALGVLRLSRRSKAAPPG